MTSADFGMRGILLTVRSWDGSVAPPDASLKLGRANSLDLAGGCGSMI
jgi:hypothetical protein